VQKDDQDFMQAAVEAARNNPRAPFGAVLVDRRTARVVASGVNDSATDPTFHAELVAISHYAKAKGSAWEHLTLYTTAEPCCMCQGAVIWSGITRVVFGISIGRLVELGWKQIEIPAEEVAHRSWRRDLTVQGGIGESQCDLLFQAALLNGR
jgi:tRNA(Arg) A34 adenosine deaminase TadA